MKKLNGHHRNLTKKIHFLEVVGIPKLGGQLVWGFRKNIAPNVFPCSFERGKLMGTPPFSFMNRSPSQGKRMEMYFRYIDPIFPYLIQGIHSSICLFIVL